MLGHSGRLANNVRSINNVNMQIAKECRFARDPEDVPSRDHFLSDWEASVSGLPCLYPQISSRLSGRTSLPRNDRMKTFEGIFEDIKPMIKVSIYFFIRGGKE